jgi:hypothetical protein
MVLLRPERRERALYVARRDQAVNKDQVRLTLYTLRSRRALTLCGAHHISPRMTIEALPDIVLLDIFEFYKVSSLCSLHEQFRWPLNRLVQVCQS